MVGVLVTKISIDQSFKKNECKSLVNEDISPVIFDRVKQV